MKAATADPGSPRVPTGGIRELGVWEAVEVYDRELAASSVEELAGGGAVAYYLRLAALEAVIAEGMRVRGAISIHRALLAGATVAEIAEVMGATCERVATWWRAWVDGQRRLAAREPGLGIDPHEVDRAEAAIRAARTAAGRVRSWSAPASGIPEADRQIGSPHP